MTKKAIFGWSLLLSTVVILVGALFKIQHYPYGNALLNTGMLLSIPFIWIGITDAFNDTKKSVIEKIIWIVGFATVSWITALLYWYQPRKNWDEQ